MSHDLRHQLNQALTAMEASFHVQVIGTFGDALVCAPAEAVAAEWLARNEPDFDQFPVKRGAETIGVLTRSAVAGTQRVEEVMEPLREGLVVSAHMPITDLIPKLKDHSYRLVLRGAQIDGLVTHSDLLKLPVRMVAFSLLTHLELVMAARIAKRWPADDDWFGLLSEGRQSVIRKKQMDLASRRMNPKLLELTDFCDKRTLCKKLVDAKGAFEPDLKRIEGLRNQVAHAGDFLDPSLGPAAVATFVERFESAKHWIHELSTEAHEQTTTT